MTDEVGKGMKLQFQAAQLRRSCGRQLGLQLKGDGGGERGGGEEAAAVELDAATEVKVEVKMEMAGKMENKV